MKILIFGAGNLLLSDEGFGVHFIRFLDQHFVFPENVELFDAGTLGIMATHKIEEADRVFLIDVVFADGLPGQRLKFDKDQILLNRIPVKLSPHQIGVQEMLLVSELRGKCPAEITLYGVIPGSLESGAELTPPLQISIQMLAEEMVVELGRMGIQVLPKSAAGLTP